jgi:hypothetical protein
MAAVCPPVHQEGSAGVVADWTIGDTGAVSSKDRRWLILWLALAAVVVVRATARKEHRGVILKHIEFGRRLIEGEELYAPWSQDPDEPPIVLHPPYPPSYGALTMPLALVDRTLGLRAARCCWALFQVGMLVLLAQALRRLPSGRAPPDLSGSPSFSWVWLLTLLVTARFVLRDMHGGGGNIINTALCVLAFAAGERGRSRQGGLLLGLSLATKPTQVWLLPVFLLLGHRRTVGHAALTGCALVLLSVLALRFDLTAWQRWIEGSWALATQADAFAVPALDFPPFTWMNQSLRCAMARYLGEVPPEFARLVSTDLWPGAGLSVATVSTMTRLASGSLLALVLATAFLLRTDHGVRRTWLVSAALCLSVLLSPLSWKAHHTALLPLVFLLARGCIVDRSRGAALLLALFAAGCAVGGDLVGDRNAEWLNSIYVVTAFDLALLGTALGMALRPNAPDGD